MTDFKVRDLTHTSTEIGGFQKPLDWKVLKNRQIIDIKKRQESVMLSELVQGVVRGRLWGSKLLNVL